MDDKKDTNHQSHFAPVNWHAMTGEAGSSNDLMKEQISLAVNNLHHQKDKVYRQAIEKHFGDFTEENAKKCSLRMAGGIEQLMCGEVLLCEIYPFEQPTFPGSSATNQITLTLKYRIF